jgi:hypothetical protein
MDVLLGCKHDRARAVQTQMVGVLGVRLFRVSFVDKLEQEM